MTRLTISAEPAVTAATEIRSRLRATVANRGYAAVAFSGGSTPDPMFDELASNPLPWSNIDVFQVDERVVDPESDDRNWRALVTRLLDPGGVPEARRHPMRVESSDLTAAAIAYSKEIAAHAPDGLDIVHLGLGDDGHTASWPPGDTSVQGQAGVTVVGPYRGHLRMTITPAVVNRAETRIWLVAGEDKRDALTSLRLGGHNIPAGLVHPAYDDLIVCDQAAGQ